MSTPNTPRATLADVAAAAGVSRSLASLALRGSRGVRPETRAKILQAASDLSYIPNLAARHLASGETGVIGVVVRDITNPFLAALAKAVYETGQAQGLDVILSTPPVSEEGAEAAARTLLARQVQGLVLIDAPRVEATIERIAWETRAIYVGRLLTGGKVSCVSTDDDLGARLVARHLLALGHRKIAHVDGGTGAGAQRRRSSFVAELALSGIEVTVLPGDYSIDAGAAAAERLLQLPERPTAVFAANDLIALGILNHVLSEGLSVPKDIAIVGYDDMPLAGSQTISLTTIRQPIERLAEQSIAALTGPSGDGPFAALRILVAPELIERRSTLGTDAANKPRRRVARS